MDPALAKFIWLVVGIGFFAGIGVTLLRIDDSDAWRNAHIAQLVLNRHGGFDVAACVLWVTLLFSMMVIVFCLFAGKVPDRLDVLMGALDAVFAAPFVTAKLKGTSAPEPAIKEPPT